MKERYFKNPGIVLREEGDDGGLLFDPDTNRLRALNATGLYIWELCDGNHDLLTILESVLENFGFGEGESTEHVSMQVVTFLEQLKSVGLIGTMSA